MAQGLLDKNIFDKNYFLYFEEFDLCKSTNDNGGYVYTASDLKVHHLGFKGSFGASKKLRIEANRLRDWHWMWSYFYFYKKNYNYFYETIILNYNLSNQKTSYTGNDLLELYIFFEHQLLNLNKA